MSAGRPSLYDPAYCERVIEMGKQGFSVVEMAAEIGVHRDTLETNWPAAHPEFFEAFTHAMQCSQAWWERTGRVGMIENNISAPIWSRSMAARFPKDWREVKGTELTGKDGGPVAVSAEKAEWTIVDAPTQGGA
ncbi:MAG: hypothetical protein KGP14_16630 [Betaproteobacteria bacterium]|nr:hypothetical protein [Betaproteobacteria bacterium]